MNILHDSFTAIMGDFYKKGVFIRVIKDKFSEHNIILSDQQDEQLIKQIDDYFANDDQGSEFSFTIDGLEDIVIDFSDLNIKNYLEEIESELPEKYERILNDISISMLETLKRDAPGMLLDLRKAVARFINTMHYHWGKAIDLFGMLLVIALEAGNDFNREFRPQAALDNDHVFDVLTRLHARACQICSEIEVLLKNGFADGAHARWRTLHEVAVVANFIRHQGNDVAERYILHDAIESYKASLLYQENYIRLGLRSISQQAVDKVKQRHDSLIARFGPSYKESYGWASDALGKTRPTFNDIEQSVDLSHMRSYYKMASHNIHANPKGVLFKLGNRYGDKFLLAGASPSGLADPAHGASISLLQITTSLLLYKVNTDRIVICKIMQKLVDEIGTEFLQAHNSPLDFSLIQSREAYWRRYRHRKMTVQQLFLGYKEQRRELQRHRLQKIIQSTSMQESTDENRDKELL